MSGIYIHIPYCKQACHYCDFHFSTNHSSIKRMTSAIVRELENQREYLSGDKVSTIYFGGGTPSLLPQEDLDKIMSAIEFTNDIDNEREVTLEVNPEDVSTEMINVWKEAGVNRISIGIQTFHNDLLQYLNRAHDNTKAKEALGLITDSFDNFNLDLIYGIPHAKDDRLVEDIIQALEYDPSHISAYALTIEPKTVFGNRLKNNKLKVVDDDLIADEFLLLHDQLTSKGYDHYEVSNYATNGYISKHNSGYWKSKKYLGVGPSAHSYNLVSRQSNISNNAKYMKLMEENGNYFTVEELDNNARVNDYILTSLRTKWGISIELIKKEWSYDISKDKENFLMQLLQNQYATLENDRLILTANGFLLADQFATELFL